MNISTLTAQGLTVDVRIWHLQMSDSDVYKTSESDVRTVRRRQNLTSTDVRFWRLQGFIWRVYCFTNLKWNRSRPNAGLMLGDTPWRWTLIQRLVFLSWRWRSLSRYHPSRDGSCRMEHCKIRSFILLGDDLGWFFILSEMTFVNSLYSVRWPSFILYSPRRWPSFIFYTQWDDLSCIIWI